MLALFLWLPGCATPPTDPDARAAFEEANDPLEPTNRAIFDVNVALDDHIVKPVAEAYRVVPEDLRKGMHNMIVTVHAPVLFGNYLMQADPDSTADTVLRFLINITAGVGGFFDVASMVGVPTHDTDFGVTLAKWGVGEGFYLMLPGFGPSNPRDAIGLGVDSLMDPIGYFATLLESFGRLVYEGIDKREPLIEPLDEIRRTSVDYYATLRSLYRQRREDQIRSGKGGANFPAPSISGPGDMPSTAPEAARPVEPPTSSANIASVAGQSQAGAELPGAADSAAGLGGNETVPAGPSEQSALANEARDPTGRPDVER
ncbi:MAG TPA: VacJ family lipoprotein [Alphaproteobacteria bacterium]|nr:VacJ family lipoprotein [Alphaproteobacteria bacterium]